MLCRCPLRPHRVRRRPRRCSRLRPRRLRLRRRRRPSLRPWCAPPWRPWRQRPKQHRSPMPEPRHWRLCAPPRRPPWVSGLVAPLRAGPPRRRHGPSPARPSCPLHHGAVTRRRTARRPLRRLSRCPSPAPGRHPSHLLSASPPPGGAPWATRHSGGAGRRAPPRRLLPLQPLCRPSCLRSLWSCACRTRGWQQLRWRQCALAAPRLLSASFLPTLRVL